jgi:hypothetical protein
MTAANDATRIHLSEHQHASLSIGRLHGTYEPPLIRLGAFVIHASLELVLTATETRAVIAQLAVAIAQLEADVEANCEGVTV